MAYCARAPPPPSAAWPAPPPTPGGSAGLPPPVPPRPSPGAGGKGGHHWDVTPSLAGEMLRIQRARSSGAPPTAICGFKVGLPPPAPPSPSFL